MRSATIVSLVGWSESGKTALLVAAIEECRRRGIPCAAAKATRHKGDFELATKDSARFRQAGASPVAFIGTGEAGLTVRFSSTPFPPDRAYLESLFPGASLVFAEGLVVEGALKVLVDKPGEELKRPLAWADVLVTGDQGLARRGREEGLRVIAPGDGAELMDIVEAYMERDVVITCDGKAVPLNDFVKEIVGNTLAALVGSLKKTAPDSEIVIRLGPANRRL